MRLLAVASACRVERFAQRLLCQEQDSNSDEEADIQTPRDTAPTDAKLRFRPERRKSIAHLGTLLSS